MEASGLLRLSIVLLLLGRCQRGASGESETTVQDRLLSLVAAGNGLSLDHLRRSLAVGWGTLYRHLDKLAKDERIVLVKAGKTRLVFARHQQPPVQEMEALAVLRTSTSRMIARDVRAHPGTSIRDVAERTGCRPRTIYYQVRQLLDAGLLKSNSRSRHFGLRATPLLERMLEGTPE